MNWDWEKLREQQQRQRKSPNSGGGGGVEPPQMDDVIEQFKKFKGPGFFFLLLVFVFIFGSSMFYTIAPEEVGIIQRFGEYKRTVQPGPHFKLPSGIETLSKIKVLYVYKSEFGFSGNYNSGVDNVSLMLTGDLNVAQVPWLVQYRISDPKSYLFNVDKPKQLLNDLAEAAMRLIVGDRSVDEVIIKRDEIATACQQLLQKELDIAETGIQINTIEMQKTNVPGPVQPSFNEVNKAQQEKETTIYKANEEYNKAIPAAQGEAERIVREAEGYALDKVNRAQGDASRFLALYAEYTKAKDVTKRRIYLEKMSEFLPKAGKKFVVDSKQKNLLPLLNIGNGKVQ